MKPLVLKMDYLGGAILADIEFWSRKENCYKPASLMLDTGASITTISEEISQMLGYDSASGGIHMVTTASRQEFVREVVIDRSRFGGFEIEGLNVDVHNFPPESYYSGVIGLNVLSRFDIHLLFSKGLIELYPIRGFLDEGVGLR